MTHLHDDGPKAESEPRCDRHGQPPEQTPEPRAGSPEATIAKLAAFAADHPSGAVRDVAAEAIAAIREAMASRADWLKPTTPDERAAIDAENQRTVARLVATIRAEEREACAKVADDYEPSADAYCEVDTMQSSAWDRAAFDIAAAIRARSP